MADNGLFGSVYNPDVLSCLANLSSDEVFTPPDIVNKMLDMLPQELFENPNTTFLDPACKSGVFLREIAKRLIKGLEKQIPDLQNRLDHIYKNQLYGIAITELTSLLSRRSVYCSKYPNSEFSVTKFDNDHAQGNIRFKRIEHVWQDGRCVFCGATQSEYDRDKSLETHAYELIHTINPEEIFNMKFDVIIGNPPYQLGVGNEGGNSSKAKAIYHLFVEKAIKLKPRFCCMITPSRWMTRTTEGISSEWIDDMLSNNHIEEIHDFPDASDCFPGVEIKGGVSYFKWNREYIGKCKYIYHYPSSKEIQERIDFLNGLGAGIVIRDPKVFAILNKIIYIEGKYYCNENFNFSGMVSPKDFFTSKTALTSSWKEWSKIYNDIYNIKYYISKSFNDVPFGWIKIADIPKNKGTLPLHKVYIPAAGGSGTDDIVLGKPFYGEPNSVCSQTYLVIGYDPDKHNFSKEQCENIIKYIKTRFFRYLVNIKKNTQNGPRGVYQFVPIQDFNVTWTDEKLYKKYKLTDDEIQQIESTIRVIEE